MRPSVKRPASLVTSPPVSPPACGAAQMGGAHRDGAPLPKAALRPRKGTPGSRSALCYALLRPAPRPKLTRSGFDAPEKTLVSSPPLTHLPSHSPPQWARCMVGFCNEHLVFVKAVRDKPFVEAARGSKGWPADVDGEIFRTDDALAAELKRLVATTNGTRKVEAELVEELEQARAAVRTRARCEIERRSDRRLFLRLGRPTQRAAPCPRCAACSDSFSRDASSDSPPPRRPQARERNPGVEYGAGTYGIDALELCNTMATMASWEVDSTQVQLSDEVLGRGSYGTVYKGTWSAAKVAVKLFSERVADPERMLESVRQEAAFLARMRHPNIIMFMGVCTQPYNLAILTELCERGSLHTVLSQHSHQPATLNWVLRLSMLSEAARGMVYLHNSNPMVIHQDLNPSNLLVDNAWCACVGLCLCFPVAGKVWEGWEAACAAVHRALHSSRSSCNQTPLLPARTAVLPLTGPPWLPRSPAQARQGCRLWSLDALQPEGRLPPRPRRRDEERRVPRAGGDPWTAVWHALGRVLVRSRDLVGGEHEGTVAGVQVQPLQKRHHLAAGQRRVRAPAPEGGSGSGSVPPQLSPLERTVVYTGDGDRCRR